MPVHKQLGFKIHVDNNIHLAKKIIKQMKKSTILVQCLCNVAHVRSIFPILHTHPHVHYMQRN